MSGICTVYGEVRQGKLKSAYEPGSPLDWCLSQFQEHEFKQQGVFYFHPGWDASQLQS